MSISASHDKSALTLPTCIKRRMNRRRYIVTLELRHPRLLPLIHDHCIEMAQVKVEYDTKGMPFRRLGSSGLRVPIFSLGGWLTLGGTVVGDPVKDIIKTAFDHGINMFDTAEGYASGNSELEMGRVIRELGLRRSELIITTKIYFGARKNEPNATGTSRKHVIEGLRESLDRLGLEYVDVVFSHRPDITVPMEETVRAFNHVIERGWAFYWATSEWSGQEIEEAYHIADKLGLIPPIAEQCKHHMFHRERPEKEYAPLYQKYQIGTTVYSALAAGLLTGKYNNGIPPDSRFAAHPGTFKSMIESFDEEEGMQQIAKVRALSDFAEKELGCSVTHLALAWVAINPNTSTVILGASRHEQVVDNLKALDVIPKLTPEVLEKIEKILDNKPESWPTFKRPALDKFGRAGI
ncbi:NADP-dependent oxidoreductase domain-containing protein [Amylocystis lapponica]|nr:NADP-dependent oxidoreductase domain-containing protein [Amylocystis lapponica]